MIIFFWSSKFVSVTALASSTRFVHACLEFSKRRILSLFKDLEVAVKFKELTRCYCDHTIHLKLSQLELITKGKVHFALNKNLFNFIGFFLCPLFNPHE